MVFGRSNQIHELAHLRLECGIVKEFQEIAVVRLRAEMNLEEVVDGGLEHESVVDGDVAYTFDTVPARLATARHRLVHHVVGDEEVGLELQ